MIFDRENISVLFVCKKINNIETINVFLIKKTKKSIKSHKLPIDYNFTLTHNS